MRISPASGRAVADTVAVSSATLGALIQFQLVSVSPSSDPIGQLPVALIQTVAVPLLLALHIRSAGYRKDLFVARDPSAVPGQSL